MSNGIVTLDGRIFKAVMWYSTGPFYCAIGQGDGTFVNPAAPPLEDASQILLKGEKIRRLYTTREYLVEAPGGAVQIGARTFDVSGSPTRIVLFEWLFDFNDANFTWKELGFFGGTITFGQYYNASAPPLASGIAGVTINFVLPLNGTGTGSLRFTAAGTTLEWRAPGSGTYGTAINVSGGGNFTLADGATPGKTIQVAVVPGSLPGGDATVGPTVDAPGDVALNGLNHPTTNPTGQVSVAGQLVFVRNIVDQAKTNAEQRPVRLLIEP
jgi:hypothetical protein